MKMRLSPRGLSKVFNDENTNQMKHLAFLLISLLTLPIVTNAQNNAPVTTSDTIKLFLGQQDIVISTSMLKSDDIDPDGDYLTIDSLYPPINGTLVKVTPSIYKYTPYSSFHGFDSVIYKICDNGSPVMCSEGLLIMRVYEFRTNAAYSIIEANEIKAGINSDGTMFLNSYSDSTLFFAPADGNVSSVFSGGLWVGGINSVTEAVHSSASMYQEGQTDFQPGPLRSVSQYSNEPDNKWNKVWKVSEVAIDYHKANFSSSQYKIPVDILSWPGNGDLTKGEAPQLAPFHDLDNDGVYEPLSGEYPKIKGDQALFFIFNDDLVSQSFSSSNKMKIEIHGLAYGYNCNSEKSINNSLIIDYKLINRSQDIFDSVYIGFYSDIDIGNAIDDRVACDVGLNSFYCYNGDLFDETSQWQNGYGYYIPSQAFTILSGALKDNDGIDNNIGVSEGESINGLGFGDGIIDNERFGMSSFIFFPRDGLGPSCCTDPTNDDEFYNYLTGKWKDGTNMIYGGTGHTNGLPDEVECKFMFPKNSDSGNFGTNGIDPQYSFSSGWSEESESITPYDRRGLSSTGPFTLIPNTEQEITVAYVFSGETTELSGSEELLLAEISKLKLMFKNDSTPCKSGAFSNVSKLAINTQKTTFYPNPTSDKLFFDNIYTFNNFQIFDAFGRVVSEGSVTESKYINVSNISVGVYFVRLETNSEVQVLKFIKQ